MLSLAEDRMESLCESGASEEYQLQQCSSEQKLSSRLQRSVIDGLQMQCSPGQFLMFGDAVARVPQMA